MAKNNCGLHIQCDGETLIATLSGELDHHGAVAVRTLIDAEIRRRIPKKAVLDLSGLDFMDSSGLGLIMGRHTLMSSLGGTLTVRRPNERVVRIFKLAGLERIVTIEEGKHEA